MRPDDPVISRFRRSFHGSVGIGGNPNRRPRFLQRLGINGYVFDMKLLAGKAHVIFGPEFFDDLNAFDEALKSFSSQGRPGAYAQRRSVNVLPPRVM